uniref:Uncharacterized protein n=1 Tax=Bursaphelenchus xylophilus TaxID=6326 RepID=A0A1I7SB46_BURXY
MSQEETKNFIFSDVGSLERKSSDPLLQHPKLNQSAKKAMEDREEANPHHNLQPVYPVYQLGTDHMGQQVFYGVQLGNEQMFASGEIYQNAGNFQQIQPQFYSPASAPDGTQFVQQPHFVNQISPQVQQGQEQQLMNMYGMQNQFRQRQFYQPQQMQGQVNYAQPVYSQVVENSGSEPRSVSALFDNSSENYTANWVSSTSSIPPEQKVPPEGNEDIESNDFGGTWPPTRSHRQPIPRPYEQTDGMMAGTSATSGGFIASSPPIQNHGAQKLEVQVGQISLNEQPRTNVYTQQTYLAYQQQPPQAFPAPQPDPELVPTNMAAASMVANPVPHARPTYSDMVKRGAPPSQHVQVHITRKEPKDQAKTATTLQNDRSKGKIPQRSQNGDRSIPGRGSANGDSERRRVPGSSESQQNSTRPSASAQHSVRSQRNGPQPSTAPTNPQTFDGNYHSPNGQKSFNPNRSYAAPSAQPAQYNWPRTASRTSTQPTSSRSVPPNSTETLHFDLTQTQNCPQQQQHFNRPAPSHQIPFPQAFNVPPPNQQRLILNQPPPGCAMSAGEPAILGREWVFGLGELRPGIGGNLGDLDVKIR